MLGKYVEYVRDPRNMLEVVERHAADVTWRQTCMLYVGDRHTLLQRARDLARAIMMRCDTSSSIAYHAPVVSAIYDIGRMTIDGRSMEEYREWVLRTLRCIREPIVFYLDKTLIGWRRLLLETRHDVGPICIIETSLQKIPMWKYHSIVSTILKDAHFEQLHPNDITNRLPAYVLIQYSKFGWLEDAQTRVIWNGRQKIVWMDAGFCRFFSSATYQIRTELPESGFSIEASDEIRHIYTITPDNYIGTNCCILRGGLWVIDLSVFAIIKNAVMNMWESQMLAKSRLDNEQIALALVYQKNPELFQLIKTNKDIGSSTSMFLHWFNILPHQEV